LDRNIDMPEETQCERDKDNNMWRLPGTF
jgi:hypothetical protein